MRDQALKRLTDWVPLVAVGPFKFGTPIDLYKEDFCLEEIEDDDSDGWAGYRFPKEDMNIYTEENKIVSIACYKEIRFLGKNILGMNLDEACDLLETRPDEIGEVIYLSDGPYITAEFDGLSAQLWVKDNIVMTASVYEYIEDDNASAVAP